MAGFDLTEINRLTADLGHIAGRAVPLAAVAVRKTAFDIQHDAQAFAPVDTGNLRSSISTTVRGLEAEVGPTASYGAYVEFGTSSQAPAAYMGPAFDRRAYSLEQALAKIADL
jgi:HK97 gp10 family phage protein